MKNNISPKEEHSPILWITSWCLRIITLAFILQMGLSYNLWIPIDRSYPTLPFFAFLPISYVDWLTSCLSGFFLVGLCIACVCKKWRQPALLLALGCFFMLILEDANRFQPWAYVYLALLGNITWYNWKPHDKRQVATLQFVLVMVYFWSGIHKLNVQFIHDVFPWLVGIFEFTNQLKTFPALGYSMGIFEVIIAALLLLPSSRRVAVILGMLLHLVILILLVTDGWNSVVYPWNAAMIFLLYILFWKTKSTPYIFCIDRRPNWLVGGLFGVLPFFYLFQAIPSWMALSLYSGTTMECDLVIKKTGIEHCIPLSLKKEVLDYGDKWLLSLDTWGMHNLNIPPLASDATYKEVGRQFCECAIEYEGYIVLYYPQKWENMDKRVVLTCEELLK